MINLPKLEELDVNGKKVIVRLDLDVTDDYTRIENSKETLIYLLRHSARLLLIGHRGRPSGDKEKDKDLSLQSLVDPIEKIIGKKVNFVEDYKSYDFSVGEVFLLENLRFDSREESNDENFTKELASLGDFYVNEAFAVSHRAHVSLVGIPKLLPHAAGIRFVNEIEHLNRVIDNPARPLIFLISGIKEDKLEMIKDISGIADKVLVAGRLPEIILSTNYHLPSTNIVVASLLPDKEDITIHSIEKFEEEIVKAKTVVLAGVIGKYEDEGHRQGTIRVFEAVANSTAYRVAGGGDTEAALTILNLTEKFDWISVGGGAMLEFLAKKTLPGIEALI